MKKLVAFGAFFVLAVNINIKSAAIDVGLAERDAKLWRFWAACRSCELAVVKELINSGIDIDSADETSCGKTALMRAALFDRADVVRLLIDRGAKLDVVDKAGFTALMTAVFYGSIAAVKLLLDAGADIYYVNPDASMYIHFAYKDGMAAIDIAYETSRIDNKAEMIKLLTNEPLRRRAALDRREEIKGQLTHMAQFPVAVTNIVDSYLGNELTLPDLVLQAMSLNHLKIKKELLKLGCLPDDLIKIVHGYLPKEYVVADKLGSK